MAKRLPVNQPGARTAATPASGWGSFSFALGKPASLESRRSMPRLPKRRGRRVSLLVHERRRVGISESQASGEQHRTQARALEKEPRAPCLSPGLTLLRGRPARPRAQGCLEKEVSSSREISHSLLSI